MESDAGSSRHPRLRRWLIGLAVLAILLALYATLLERVKLRLDSDMQRSLRDTPLMDDTRHRRD